MYFPQLGNSTTTNCIDLPWLTRASGAQSPPVLGVFAVGALRRHSLFLPSPGPWFCEANECNICPVGRCSVWIRVVRRAATGCAWRARLRIIAATAAERFTTYRRLWRRASGCGRVRWPVVGQSDARARFSRREIASETASSPHRLCSSFSVSVGCVACAVSRPSPGCPADAPRMKKARVRTRRLGLFLPKGWASPLEIEFQAELNISLPSIKADLTECGIGPLIVRI